MQRRREERRGKEKRGKERRGGLGRTFDLVYVEGLCILAIPHSCEESDIPILRRWCDAMRYAISHGQINIAVPNWSESQKRKIIFYRQIGK